MFFWKKTILRSKFQNFQKMYEVNMFKRKKNTKHHYFWQFLCIFLIKYLFMSKFFAIFSSHIAYCRRVIMKNLSFSGG